MRLRLRPDPGLLFLPADAAARRHAPDFSGWQAHPMQFDVLANDARVACAVITAGVPEVKH